jgi:hypothetical protein
MVRVMRVGEAAPGYLSSIGNSRSCVVLVLQVKEEQCNIVLKMDQKMEAKKSGANDQL